MDAKVRKRLRASVAKLPDTPGVYRFYDAAGELLYVGKARALARRVRSYLGKGAKSPRVALLAEHIARLEVTHTPSETDALILEHEQINALSPRYNVLFRDDKSFPYLRISGHAVPRLSSYRGKPGPDCYGPYPSGWAVRESIRTLQKVFRLRTCTDVSYANRTRPCLLHQIDLCTAPCVGKISKEAYAADAKSARDFLAGTSDDLATSLAARMEEAAQAQRYEEAARLRDSIQALANIRHVGAVGGGAANVDYLGLHQDGASACVHLAAVRGDRLSSELDFFPANVEGKSPAEILCAFVAWHYGRHKPPPRVVLRAKVDTKALAALAGARHRSVFVAAPRRSDRERVAMASANARAALERRGDGASGGVEACSALAGLLGLPRLSHLECFDISHSMGEAASAACVVCVGGRMEPSQYRRFNLKKAREGDDYAGMREVIVRRYRRKAEGKAAARPLPDLIVIDGGGGQLKAAQEALAAVGAPPIPLLGIAKGAGRRPGHETLLTGGGEIIELAPASAPFRLLQLVRDEAHRFALAGHRRRRDKRRRTSTLQDIEGIGPAISRALINRFGGLQGLRQASVADLSKIRGVGPELATRIYRAFHA